jgi:hypothetical protein
MTERIFLYLLNAVGTSNFLLIKFNSCYCHDKNTPSGFLSLKIVKRNARHVDGKTVLRWMWHVASEMNRIVYKRLMGICGGCVLWMVD